MTSERFPGDEADTPPVQHCCFTHLKEGISTPPPGTTVNIICGNIGKNTKVSQAQQLTNSPSAPETTPFINDAPLIGQINPANLQVHQAVLPSQDPSSHSFLTPYLQRPHDNELREHLKPALNSQTSVLAMMTGDSSVGKTRSLYEALHNLAPKRKILQPKTITDLLFFLNRGFVDDQVVLWLNEAQKFFQGTGSPEVASELHYLLMHKAGVVAVGTMWTTPYWEKLTRTGATWDPHSQVRELLMCPSTVQISVPDHLSTSEQGEWKRLAIENDDRRMAEALEAGTQDLGRVVQHLSGGPELLKAYLDGPGFFTRVEHALLSTALFARILGHQKPFTTAFLSQATDGILDPRERPIEADWARTALTSLSTGQRPNGQRVDIRSTLTALHTFVPHGGTEPLYELDDYLEQHLRDHFGDQLAAPSLWQALLDHTTHPDDLRELAEAASFDGMNKHALRLYHKAAIAEAPVILSGLVSLLSPETDPQQKGAFWAVSRVDITDPYEVASVLKELREAGFKEATYRLLERDPAAHVSLADPSHVSDLLEELREARQEESLTHLANRISSHTDFPDSSIMPRLIAELLESGQEDAADTLASYAAKCSDISCPYTTAVLLNLFFNYSYEEELEILMARDPAAKIDLTNPGMLTILLNTLSELDFEQEICRIITRSPAAHADIDNSFSTALLMDFLIRNNWSNEVQILANRSPMKIAEIIHFDPENLPKEETPPPPDKPGDTEETFSRLYPSKSHPSIDIYGRELDGSPAQPWEWGELFPSDS